MADYPRSGVQATAFSTQCVACNASAQLNPLSHAQCSDLNVAKLNRGGAGDWAVSVRMRPCGYPIAAMDASNQKLPSRTQLRGIKDDTMPQANLQFES